MIGKEIRHYKISEKLGSGGMSTVYKAFDTTLERYVALKFLSPYLNQTEDGKNRFEREAKTASSLEHPNICTVYEIGETDDGQMYIAMPAYDAVPLQDKIEDGSLSIDEAIEITIQIAKGLSSAHSKEIVHRDIKPANILIAEDNQVTIVDFGLAKLAGQTLLTKEGTTLGTVSYMSPEQTAGTDLDHRTDIWALGVVLYEMLAGQRPFKGEYEQAVVYSIMNEEPLPVQSLNPEIPDEVAKIVHRALQKKMDQRYSSINKMLVDLELFQRSRLTSNGAFDLRTILLYLKKPQIALSVGAVFVLIILGIAWFVNRQGNIRWAKEEALSEIGRLIDVNWRDFTDAYDLAEEAEKYIPNDPQLAEYIDVSSVRINVTTEPEGGSIYIKEYDRPEEEWVYLGVTPIDSLRMPIGIYRWRIEKEGYEPVYAAATSWAVSGGSGELIQPNHFHRILDEFGAIPTDMVRVSGSQSSVGPIDDFYIDRYEVTNRKYKEFVDDDGYQTKDYWEHEFVKDGQVFSWEEAMAEFTDQTNRPGPSTWQAGTFLEGTEEYPVTGISWYEASAYTKWAGRSLPTSHHWGLARGEMTQLIQWPQLGGYAVFAPYSNFGSNGPVQAGSLPGYTSFGAYDMAGNVREWCWNLTPEGRLIRGGAWNSNTYAFAYLSHAPPFDRSETNGFRTAYYPNPENIPEQAFAEVTPQIITDFSEEETVSDEIYQIYKQQFAYDFIPLNGQVEERDTTAEFWDYERVTFNAAYNNERIIGHLFLPENTSPPYQTVVYFPGSAALFQPTSQNLSDYYEFPVFLSFLVKNGRAVFFPVYKGTFERRADHLVPLAFGNNSHAYTEYTVQLVKDFKRSMDYLESRDDINSQKIAFYGMSWGGNLGAIIPAVEERVKVNVLLSGAMFSHGQPEAKQINYITRVETPTIMLNGRYDSNAPYETSINPMFDLLGTPDEHKKLLVYETDHIPPKVEYMREILDWLDLYFGTVE